MDLPPNTFKRGLRGGARAGADAGPMVGTWAMSASPVMAEALGFAGYDFVVLDMEHAANDVPQTLALMQALAGPGTSGVVRLPWNEPVVVKRLLDCGAQTLMFPFVQTVEEARRAVASTRYPPLGIRGYAAMHRASRYGAVGDYTAKAAEEICVVLQLETADAIGRLPEIAAVEGVDCLFIGPGDLSASLGEIGNVGHPKVQEALAAAAKACRDAGTPSGILAQNPEMARRFLDYGYSWVAVASDLGMMMSRAREFIAATRG